MHKKEVKNFVRCLPKSRLPGRFFRFQARNSFQAKPKKGIDFVCPASYNLTCARVCPGIPSIRSGVPYGCADIGTFF